MQKWKVLVYLAGDNNLVEEMVWSLQEIRRSGDLPVNTSPPTRLSDHLAVVAQFDPQGNPPGLYTFEAALWRQLGSTPVRLPDFPKSALEQFEADDVFDLVRSGIQPSSQHLELAARWVLAQKKATYGHVVDALGVELEKKSVPQPQERAERFVARLLHHKSRNLNLALKPALAEIIAHPGPADPGHKKKADDVLTRITVKKVAFPGYVAAVAKEIERLAGRLSKAPDSVLRNMSGLSSPLMVEQFIEKQSEGKDTNHIVILSGHGSGAVGDFLRDDDPESALSIPKLGTALRKACNGKKIQILGMDSCLMSMAEVCYEIQDCVEYLVGAEGFIDNIGWPYHHMLKAVADSIPNPNPNTSAKELAKRMVHEYINFYRDYEVAGLSADLSVIKLDEIGLVKEGEGVAAAVHKLATLLTASLKKLDDREEMVEVGTLARPTTLQQANARSVRNALLLAHWYAQSYKWEQYVDLWDFCSQLERFLGDDDNSQEIRGACEKVRDRIDDAVVVSCFCGPEFQHSHGLSIYFPWDVEDFALEYANLRFARDTGWKEFLDEYLKKTRRVRRDQNLNWGKASGQPLEPIRIGIQGDPLLHKTGTHSSARTGTHSSARTGTHSSARTGTHAQSKGYCIPVLVKNPPDGFYRCRCDKD